MNETQPQKTPAVATAPAAALPKAPITRRDFLWLGWSALLGFIGASLAATLRFLVPNVLYEPSQKFNAGHLTTFPEGVSTKWAREQRVWVVRGPKGIYVLWARCTHLGCTPNWFADQGRFRCPCHGSNFNPQGDVIAGPAPRPLWRCKVELAATGDVIIDKAVLEGRPGFRDKAPFFAEV